MIIVFSSEQTNIDNVLHQLAEDNYFIQSIEQYACIEDVESRLRRPHPEVSLLILIIKNASEIIEITKIRSILLDCEIIVVLPFRDNGMVSWAQSFGPRFIAYATDGQKRLTSALRKRLDSGRRL